MKGYIKLHRKLMNSPVWQDPLYLKLWMYCLMKASHKEHDQLVGNQIIKLLPGQFVTGRNVLEDDLNKGMKPDQKVSNSTWWRYLNNLEKWEMLNIKKTNKYSVISIVKWSEYQQDEQQLNIKRTTDEQQLNTNKNGKNVKNGKKKEYTSKIKDLLSLFSPINNFNKLNKDYWNEIRETRKTGTVSESVIFNTMNKWVKYDLSVVEYALKNHIENHKGKREEYTLGIMRNTPQEEAKTRLSNPIKKKGGIDLNDFNLDD